MPNGCSLLLLRLYTVGWTTATFKQVARAAIHDQLAKDEACVAVKKRAQHCQLFLLGCGVVL